MEAPRFASDPTVHDTGLQNQSDSLSRLIDQLLGLIRRQFLLIIIIIVLAIGLGVVYLMTTPPVYTAHAKVLLDTNRTTPLQQQTGPIIFFQTMDLGSVMTQVEILKSDGLAQRVVDNLHLAGDPNFISGSGSGFFQGLFGALVRKAEKLEAPPDQRSQTELNRAALGKILGGRSVARVGDTYVLDIGYSASDAALAAKMSNALADAYIDEQLDSKYQSTQRATVWLQDRIKELRAQAAAADRAIFDYKEKNKIVDVGGGSNSNSRLLDEDQVVQLNTQLISTRAAAADAKVRLDRINEIMRQDIPDAATAETLQNSIIGGLRSQYLELARRARIFADRYGPTHLAVVNLQTQMAELRHSMRDELNRIAQSYKSDYEIANTRIQAIEKSLAGVIASAQLLSRDRIGLTDLETTAKIYHSIYDNFLNQYMQASQQQSFPSTQARVISQAQAGAQSAPNTHNVLATAIFLGLMLGFGAGILREAADRVFRTRNQVETTLRANCLAVLPRLGKSAVDVAHGKTRSASARDEAVAGSDRIIVPTANSIMSNAIDDPHSIFAEGLRSIKVAADIASAIKENKVIGVTSSVPKEGKSTICSNFAELMAHAGKRVILMDGDLRNLTVSRGLARGAKAGLLEVLTGQSTVQNTIYTDTRTGLHFLPAVIDSRISHTDEILASKPFKMLLESLRKDYDYILVDLPPLAPISDARATAGLIDSYIYVVEWGRTRINLVRDQLIAAPELYDRLLGVVLSKANLKVLARYERYYGYNYYKYYNARYRYGA
jgi:polysaccharide biosynthesis transport protein